MKYIHNIFYLLAALRFAKCYDTYISGGSFTTYNEYPHSVFLDIADRLVCGGTILNQYIVLTAAHCLYDSNRYGGNVIIKYGHENIYKMKTTKMRKYIIHEKYDDIMLDNDICLLVSADDIKLSKNVKRVIVMANPPQIKYANVAGWGVDETGDTMTYLKQAQVEMRKPDVCSLINQDRSLLPPYLFCAGPITGVGTALSGDSGSALVLNGYIQIGIVSFKSRHYSLVAYTNVSYYMRWIKKNSKRLFCKRQNS